MDANLKTKWINALLGGEYKQATGMLPWAAPMLPAFRQFSHALERSTP